MLDQYAGTNCLRLRQELATVFKAWQELAKEFHSLQQNEVDLERKIDLLKFQINEINQAGLVLGEDEDLLKERDILAASEKLYAAAAFSYQALYDNAGGRAAVELLEEAEQSLEQIASIDPRLESILETLREAACQAEEVARALRGYQEQVQFDPQRLTEIEDRLDEIVRLKREYWGNIGEVLCFAEKCQQELDGIANREARLG